MESAPFFASDKAVYDINTAPRRAGTRKCHEFSWARMVDAGCLLHVMRQDREATSGFIRDMAPMMRRELFNALRCSNQTFRELLRGAVYGSGSFSTAVSPMSIFHEMPMVAAWRDRVETFVGVRCSQERLDLARSGNVMIFPAYAPQVLGDVTISDLFLKEYFSRDELFSHGGDTPFSHVLAQYLFLSEAAASFYKALPYVSDFVFRINVPVPDEIEIMIANMEFEDICPFRKIESLRQVHDDSLRLVFPEFLRVMHAIFLLRRYESQILSLLGQRDESSGTSLIVDQSGRGRWQKKDPDLLDSSTWFEPGIFIEVPGANIPEKTPEALFQAMLKRLVLELPREVMTAYGNMGWGGAGVSPGKQTSDNLVVWVESKLGSYPIHPVVAMFANMSERFGDEQMIAMAQDALEEGRKKGVDPKTAEKMRFASERRMEFPFSLSIPLTQDEWKRLDENSRYKHSVPHLTDNGGILFRAVMRLLPESLRCYYRIINRVAKPGDERATSVRAALVVQTCRDRFEDAKSETSLRQDDSAA